MWRTALVLACVIAGFGPAVTAEDCPEIVGGWPYSPANAVAQLGTLANYGRGAVPEGNAAIENASWSNPNPSFSEKAKLLPSDGGAVGRFGFSVAVSQDVVVVGQEFNDGCFVFERPPEGWSGTLNEVAQVFPTSGTSGDRFGYSVAVVDDVVFVGAFLADGMAPGTGAVYVFERPPSGWVGTVTESAVLVASDGMSESLGVSIAATSDVVVAGSYDNAHGYQSGAAYVFPRPVSGWSGQITESARLEPSDPTEFAFFGCAVAVDAGTIVVGSHHGGVSQRPGVAYVFEEPPGGWAGTMSESAKLQASDVNLEDFFGASAAISGETVVVGSPESSTGAVGSGSAYVFEEPPEGWTGVLSESAKLVAETPTIVDLLGYSVAAAGDLVFAGSPSPFADGTEQGRVRVYERPVGGWAGVVTESSILAASDGHLLNTFGCSVAYSDPILVVGAYNDATNGSAYVFESDHLFSDSFESGDTSAWSTTVP